MVEENEELLRFCRALIAFRRAQPTVRRRAFLSGQPEENGELPEITWFSPLGTAVDWNSDGRAFCCLWTAPSWEEDPKRMGRDILMLYNAAPDFQKFLLPLGIKSRNDSWHLFLDTAAASPADIYPDYDGPPPPASGKLTLIGRSMRCYVSVETSSSPSLSRGLVMAKSWRPTQS